MLTPDADPKYHPRNAAKSKSSTWGVYRRLLGYAFDYKARLAVSIVFALIVTISFMSIILSVAVAVDVLFGDEVRVNAQIASRVDTVASKASFLAGLLPWSTEEIKTGLQHFVSNVRADPSGRTRLRVLTLVSTAIIVLSILAGIARYLQEYFAGSIGADISVRLGQEMYRNVMGLSLTFFEQRTTGEILARFTNDIFMVNRGLAGVFVKVMREPFKAAGFLAIALSIHPKLTLIGLGALPAAAYVIVRVGKKLKKSMRRSLEKIGSMASVANETFAGIAIIKGFCMESHEVRRTDAEFLKLRRFLRKTVKADALVGPLVEIVLILGLAGFVVFAGHLVVQDKMVGGDLVALSSALAFLLDPVRKLTSVNNMIQTSVASAERVFEFIDMKPEVVESPNAIEIPPLGEALAFEDVRFSYDGKTEVLNSIDLRIAKGEMVALVGFSGAGKSTLVKLVPRFYDVTGGRIAIDGVDIREATFRSLRSQISIVTQNTILFNESVRDNIAFGEASYSDTRVREAAKAARAGDFIERLPQGYDTIIGEAGGTLSGGQRQRIAIARALIKDPCHPDSRRGYIEPRFGKRAGHPESHR